MTRDEQLIEVIGDLGSATAIDVAHEMVDRGYEENTSAIGAVDSIRNAIRRLMREGRVKEIASRPSGLPVRQKVYALT